MGDCMRYSPLIDGLHLLRVTELNHDGLAGDVSTAEYVDDVAAAADDVVNGTHNNA